MLIPTAPWLTRFSEGFARGFGHLWTMTRISTSAVVISLSALYFLIHYHSPRLSVMRRSASGGSLHLLRPQTSLSFQG